MSTYVKLFLIAVVICSVLPACAESLWPATSQSMFQDHKARQVGDLITIVIVEASSSSVQAGQSYDKSFTHSNGAAVGPIPLSWIPNMGFNSTQKGGASGSNTVTSSLATKLTARVTAVEENGNLKVTADRSVVTNGEKQQITLTGVVRPQDVGTDNSVQSTFLSEVNIDYKGKGPIADRQKEGLISKILKLVF